MPARQDIFPAYITLSASPPVAPASRASTTPHAKRVILTATHLLVYVDSSSPHDPPVLAFSSPYDPASLTTSRHGFAVSLTSSDQAQTMTVTRSSGCGCGSRLRSFRPTEARSLDASPARAV